MSRASLALATMVAATLLVATPPAASQDLTDLAEACIESGGDERMCRGLKHFAHTLGVVCRNAAANDPACESVDGTVISEELVAEHEQSWLARALALQRRLDEDMPLRLQLWAHTHNSYNADAYPPTFYGLDRNQIYTMTDQLRMGIRAIEIDLHWAESTSGDPEQLGRAVVVCHGAQIPAEVHTFHFGCGVNDPLLRDSLEEVKAWMDENPDEFLMIYLENQLEDDETAHDLAARAIDDVLGDLVYRPSSRCAELPMDTTRRELQEEGARVILAGNCGPGLWGAWVHERGTRWLEGGLSHGDDYPEYPCTERREEQSYDHNWIRHWADETGLSNGVGEGGDMSVDEARNMVRCGVNMIGFDNLVPFDARLAELAWSWAPDQPARSSDGACARHAADGRFYSDDCRSVQRFACFDGAAWHITRGQAPWEAGPQLCEAQTPGIFYVPRNGHMNELLKEAKPADTEVWLNYRAVDQVWTPGPVAGVQGAEES